MSHKDKIIIRGLKQNNLKNVSLEIPKEKIIVFTGVSGSGKSSIVFDTIAAESQRQMNETYTAFIRGRLPKYKKPRVDLIDNLTASVIIDQARLGGNARSTVGTISDMYSALRLLFSRIGTPYVGTASYFSFNDPTECVRNAPVSEKSWIWIWTRCLLRIRAGMRVWLNCLHSTLATGIGNSIPERPVDLE